MSFPWRALMVVSLAINILIVGAAVGFLISGFPRGGPRGFDGPRFGQGQGQGQGLRALPETERRELITTLTSAYEGSRDLRGAAQQARRETNRVVALEPYDEPAVRKALADMRAKDNAVLEYYQDVLASSLGKLSAEQRVAALRAASRPGPGGPGRLRGGGDGRRGDDGRDRDRGDGPPPSDAPPPP